jgi:uncharacterized iron-regulated membrane protein
MNMAKAPLTNKVREGRAMGLYSWPSRRRNITWAALGTAIEVNRTSARYMWLQRQPEDRKGIWYISLAGKVSKGITVTVYPLH